eukprot:TRINITY_DN643_c0_g2_i2.p1 TRINITY_DN643_c0_g2~~TRINITY_DN643_c0_g2_i2.p1  ORF type:complete len:199 (+),score=45.35 TRINITY_DN643_c0_g2_i2:127-723(+)
MGRPFYLRHSLLFFLGFIVISGPALTSAQDATYLQLFASSIPNFPPYFWVALLTSPCPTGSWQGVVCDDSGNVTKVDLSYVNGGSQHVPKLNATLSWNITGVKQLQELNLANNLFYGSIVALMCMAQDPANRPTMTEVTKMLSVRELAEKWGQWQAEASVSKDEEDLIGIAKQKPSADIWKNNTTAISLSDFELTSPR